jgi:phosphoglycerate kinase
MSVLEGIKTIRDLDLTHKRVIIRADLDVALDHPAGGGDLNAHVGRPVSADTRVREALPTIRHALDAGARVIVASHRGAPDPIKGPGHAAGHAAGSAAGSAAGQAAGTAGGLGMEAVGLELADLLGCEVHLPEDSVGDAPKKVVQDLRPGQICLLENLRFHAEEAENDDAFARQLADLCDAYVGDDLRAARLAHASVSALPRIVRERACGFLVEEELLAADALVTSPSRPFVAVLGGASLSGSIELIDALLGKVDALCIGGAMANTLLAAHKIDVKASRAEHDKLPLARNVLDKARDLHIPLILPVDVVVAGSPDDPDGLIVDVGRIPDAAMALDVGPRTLQAFSNQISGAKTVLWHGPMGMAERPAFAGATMALARAMSRATGFTVVGGTDSAAAAAQAGQDEGARFGHVSTGGALLDLLAGKRLPGIEALRTTTTDT